MGLSVVGSLNSVTDVDCYLETASTYLQAKKGAMSKVQVFRS